MLGSDQRDRAYCRACRARRPYKPDTGCAVTAHHGAGAGRGECFAFPAPEAAVKDPAQPDTQKDEYLSDARYAHKDRKDAADHEGVNPRDTSSMPRGEDDEQTRSDSPEFHDRPGAPVPPRTPR